MASSAAAQPAQRRPQLDVLRQPYRPRHDRGEHQSDHDGLHEDVGRHEHRPGREVARQLGGADDGQAGWALTGTGPAGAGGAEGSWPSACIDGIASRHPSGKQGTRLREEQRGAHVPLHDQSHARQNLEVSDKTAVVGVPGVRLSLLSALRMYLSLNTFVTFELGFPVVVDLPVHSRVDRGDRCRSTRLLNGCREANISVRYTTPTPAAQLGVIWYLFQRENVSLGRSGNGVPATNVGEVALVSSPWLCDQPPETCQAIRDIACERDLDAFDPGPAGPHERAIKPARSGRSRPSTRQVAVCERQRVGHVPFHARSRSRGHSGSSVVSTVFAATPGAIFWSPDAAGRRPYRSRRSRNSPFGSSITRTP